ncbi:hypothetical protein B0H14DRAFT_3487238 [Mycena olivaceomarginata]|nr:hypothetical protein B0H14DRAFT_3487238 [Mycena olivaceomarginata]
MRFLAHAHLVVLGLLSLGITAYAQGMLRGRGLWPQSVLSGPPPPPSTGGADGTEQAGEGQGA